MIKGCAICGAKARKSICCGQKLCEGCTLNHRCPRAQELLAIADDPVRKKAWLAANAPEEELTTQVIAGLNALPGVTAWRTKRRQGAHKSDDLDGLLDVAGFAAPDGISLFVETKRNHKDGCGCGPCDRQRDFGARASGAGCVVVLGVRSVQAALDGVRMGLARARGRMASMQEDPPPALPRQAALL